MSVKLACQRGFTTVLLMGVLLIGGLLVLATFAAVDPDIGLSRADQDSKQAYAAAESGLQWYLNALANDNAYYRHCDDPPPPSPTEEAPVNHPYPDPPATPAAPFVWRNLPGEQAKYAIELLPVAPATQCIFVDPNSNMIDPYGNMRLRISGRSRGKTRTIIATLRRLNFLDFIYFTNFETLDPVATSDPAVASTVCARPRDQRPSSPCVEIRFVDEDEILGPFHTNDNILVCGSPQFGRGSTDRIEINGPRPFESACGGSSPDWQGKLIHPAGPLEMPPSNASIQGLADPAYRFRGRTEIQLNGASMNVQNVARFGDSLFHTMSMPPNGVVYVDNDGVCTSGYTRAQKYDAEELSCGNAWVSGNYGRDLTIAADNDVVINGSLRRANAGLLLGLVANNFVRVYHPVQWSGNTCTGNASGALTDPTIEAAILALKHSFIVDNWECGARLGDLTVDGAIAQYYRGPVGTTAGTGYLKNYVYNDRLRYREPPHFLDPVQSAWRIARQTEQLPPRSKLPD